MHTLMYTHAHMYARTHMGNTHTHVGPIPFPPLTSPPTFLGPNALHKRENEVKGLRKTKTKQKKKGFVTAAKFACLLFLKALPLKCGPFWKRHFKGYIALLALALNQNENRDPYKNKGKGVKVGNGIGPCSVVSRECFNK